MGGGEQYDCATCTVQQRRDRGCHGGAKFKWQSSSDVYEDVCPQRYVLEERDKYALWAEYKQFGLAYPGSPSEQPVVYMDIIRVLNQEHAEYLTRKRAEGGDKR